jgi:FixJ family two-component response regulator
MRGLIVDNDASMRRALVRLLSAANYDCLDFGSAEEVMAADVQPIAGFVITAIHLPGISGFSLMRLLRVRHERMPAIFTTSYDSVVLRDEAKKFQTSAYLAKPFEAAALFDAIEALVCDAGLP